MKSQYKIAVLLTALLLIPFFDLHAEEKPAFTIDQRRVLQGMNRSWLQGYEPSISSNVLNLVVPILSDLAEGTIRTELILPDEAVSPFKPQNMYAKTQRAESGLYAVRLSLNLYSDRRSGDYPCILRVTGKTRAGEALQTDFPYTLRIRDGQPNTEIQRIEITDLQSDLTVGGDGEIRFLLKNPCRTVTFERPVLHVSDPSGDLLPREVDVLYLPNLAPGETKAVTYPMTALPKASVSPHILKIALSWTALGQQTDQSESYTVPVRQEIRLEQGGLKMASSVIAGDSVTLSLPLMNMGRADVVNVLATLRLPGITDRQSVLVGTISPGDTRQAQITITPDKDQSGAFEGSLTVEAADNDGNPASFSLPVHLTVEKPAKPAEDAGEALQEKEKPPFLAYGLAAGCGVLLALLILQGILLRKKIHRLEEDKL